jgi:hypothetical protein
MAKKKKKAVEPPPDVYGGIEYPHPWGVAERPVVGDSWDEPVSVVDAGGREVLRLLPGDQHRKEGLGPRAAVQDVGSLALFLVDAANDFAGGHSTTTEYKLKDGAGCLVTVKVEIEPGAADALERERDPANTFGGALTTVAMKLLEGAEFVKAQPSHRQGRPAPDDEAENGDGA